MKERFAGLWPYLINGCPVAYFREISGNTESLWTASFKTKGDAIREVGFFLYQNIYKELAKK